MGKTESSAADSSAEEQARPKKRFGPSDLLFLALLGGVSYAGGRLVVGFFTSDTPPDWSPAPIVFDERVRTERNPFVADVLALTQVVEQRFSYLEHRRVADGLDLSALEAAALAELGGAGDEDSFRRVVKRYVAGLHDGHAWVRFKEHRLPAKRHWPFAPLLVKEGVMVDGVHPDAADVLRRGDLVLSADGLEMDRQIAAWARDINASSDAARRRKALAWFTAWTTKTDVELTLAREGEGVVKVKVECPLLRLEIPKPGALATGREARMLDDGVALFRPGDFSAPKGSGFKQASPEDRKVILADSYAALGDVFAGFAGARALILDLRGNPGGTDLLGQALVSYLLPSGHTYYSLSALRRDGWSKPLPRVCEGPEPEHKFRGPLVCLIDSRTFSVADNVAACLRDLHPDVTFLGRNTGSGTGAPRAFTLPRTGCQVTFCTQRVYSAKGRLIEGTGVAPDTPIIRTREDVLAGRDTVFEAALQLLKR